MANIMGFINIVLAPDGQMDGRKDGRTWRKQYPSAFGGGLLT